MPTQVQFRRGNTAQIQAFTGANGEIAINYETHQIVVQDGNTAGGFPVPNSQIVTDSYSNAINFASNASNINTGTLSSSRLPFSGVIANTYGNSSSIPVITIDSTGRITSATVNAVAGVTSFNYSSSNNTFSLATGDGGIFRASINSVNAFSVTGNLVVTNDVNISGNLTVTGTTTFINTTSLDVKDKNITIAKGSTSASAADGAGITVDGANIGWYYDNAANGWTSNVGILPSSDFTFNLGSSSNRWSNVYSNNIIAINISGNGSSITNVNASTVGGNTASDLRIYTDNQAGNAYSNATVFASNASNINSGTISEARLPYRMNQNVTTANNVTFNDLYLTGNLTVGSNVNVIGANNLAVIDNMIYLNANANYANPDIGITAGYNDGTYHHTGFFRDASDGVWKVFDSYDPEPDASIYIDTTNTTFHIANFQANVLFAGNTSTNWFSANTSGVYVSSTLIGNSTGPYGKNESNLNVNSSLLSNNSTYFNGKADTYYTNATNISSGTLAYERLGANVVNTSSNFIITGVHTHNSNLNIGISATIIANNSVGSNGQVLTSNGSTLYWSTVLSSGFIDGGTPDSVYLSTQKLDGGNPNSIFGA